MRLLELAALDGVSPASSFFSDDLGDACSRRQPADRAGVSCGDHGERPSVGQTPTQTPQPMQSSGETAMVY